MNKRDGFNSKTTEILAKRASFICSNPTCKCLTIAASEMDDMKVLYTGKASHITAAAPKGPRYDKTMTQVQRSDISNAIFLCSNCAEMIDKNKGLDFPVVTLLKWKDQHEVWVRENLNKAVANSIVYVDINLTTQPTLTVLEVVYKDQNVTENLVKKNKKLKQVFTNENIECFKTFIIFEYKSEYKKDNIDFKVNANTILHVEMKKRDEIFETSTWVYENSIKGYRFFNPSNGIYEMIFYTKIPIQDIWSFVRFYINGVETKIEGQ